MATLALLKRNVFWNKGFDVIISVHDKTNQILSCHSSHIVDLVMLIKLGNCSISLTEIIVTSILKGYDQKKTLNLRGSFGST